MTARRWLWVLIVGSTAMRLGWAASLGPMNDEAYHSLFTVHPAWSYFDHPPMLAWVEGAGLLATGGAPASPLAIRLGFVALFAGSTWLMARLAGRFYGPRAGVLAAFVLNASGYYTVAAGAFALPDGPLLFFWLLTLNALAAAFKTPVRLRFWVAVGLAWGGAMLSKYHAVFLPAGALLYGIAEPSARRVLRTPGPYLAALVGLAAFSPVIYWNATHGWASFAFQGGRATGALRFRPELLAMGVLGPAIYLLPWIWLRLAGVLANESRTALRGDGETSSRFLLCMAAPPLSAFLAVSCVRPVLPHWTLVGFLPLMPLLGRAWDGRFPVGSFALRRRVAILAALPVALAAVFLLQSRTGFLQRVGGGRAGLMAPAADPTLDPIVWRQVARELERRGLVGEPGTFLFTGTWFHSGHLAMATGYRAPVLCYSPNDARGFGFWSKPGDWLGLDGILVCLDERPTEPGFYDPWFERIEPIAEFQAGRGGRPVRKVRIFRCTRQTRPFPFDGSMRPGQLAEVRRAHDRLR